MEYIKYGKHYTILNLKNPKDGLLGSVVNVFYAEFNDTKIESGAQYSVVPLSGLDNGIGRGSAVQKVGDGGLKINVDVFLTGLYQQQRSRVIKWHQDDTILTIQLPDFLYGQTNASLSGINKLGIGNNLYVKIVGMSEQKAFAMDNTIDLTTKITLTLQEVKYTAPKKTGLIANIKDLASKISNGIVAIENYIQLGTSGINSANIFLDNAMGTISNLSQTFSDISFSLKKFNNNIGNLINTPKILAQEYNKIINSIQKSVDSVTSINSTNSTKSSVITFSKSLISYNKTIQPKPKTSTLNGQQLINTNNILLNILNGLSVNLNRYIGFMCLLTVIKNSINKYNNEAEIKEAIKLLETEYLNINTNELNGLVNDFTVAEIFRQDTANHDFIQNAEILLHDIVLKLKNRLALVSNIEVFISGKNTIWDILYQNYYNVLVIDGIDINIVINAILTANNLQIFDIIENRKILIPNVVNL